MGGVRKKSADVERVKIQIEMELIFSTLQVVHELEQPSCNSVLDTMSS